ncbi:MAG: FAD-dependent oxidoreductase [Planctomycetota bacterium]
MQDRSPTRTDVVILGSGLAGSIAALCLRRRGFEVVLADQGTHPRFALGESTTTPASLWLRVLSRTFDVPELLNLASAEALTRNVAATSGIKNNFGYLYHPEGAARPSHAWQAIIPQAFLTDHGLDRMAPENEMHYFRQDVDAYLWASALRAGAVGRPAMQVAEMAIDDEGVRLRTEAGETIEARFVIDASGHRSPVARHLGLREETPRMRTHSRSLFTHMIGVRPYEDAKLVPDSMAAWSHGTLHHFFDGGWVWVIPFNNHPGSTNRLCSVGVNFDHRRFPRREGLSPEDEWREFLAAHPSIAVQFENATPVRPWIQTDRLQYSSRACVGNRFWMTAHSAGAVDALYSMGNINTFHTLAVALPLIASALEEDDLRRERLEPVERLTDALLRFQDRIVCGSYAGSRAPEMLRVWIALWSLTDTARIRKVLMPLVRHVRTGDPKDLADCLSDPADIVTGVGMQTGITDAATVLDELDGLCDIMAELEHEGSSLAEVSQRLNHAIESKERYGINLGEMDYAFSKIPWLFEPLARNGLRCHATCFLTPYEMQTLGTGQT